MPDEKHLRRRILLKLASSPMTLVPFVGGVTAAVCTWALDLRPEIGLFAALAGFLVGCGTFVTRLVVGGETAARETIEEIRAEALGAREAALDELDARLSEDGDPRTESALRDLRTFAETFGDDHMWTSGLNTRSAFDVVEGVEKLFDRCVKSLEVSLQLLGTARKMNSKEARQPLLQQRERIIREVSQSVAQLGKVFTEVENLKTADSAPAGLARVRTELDRSLAFARSIDEKMQSLDKEYDVSEFE
ncbi:MAG: hypothetical protein GY851_33710 [bacterium]|nr:hypothetical protein [bacterium]